MKCDEVYETDDGKRFTCDGELQRFDTDTIVCDKPPEDPLKSALDNAQVEVICSR